LATIQQPIVRFQFNFAWLGSFCKRGLSRHVVSVRPSVTFVDSVDMNKRIFNFFHHRVAAPLLLLTASIGRPSATRYKQSRSSVTMYSARPTKRCLGLALYRVTVVRESCVWQQLRLNVTPKTIEQNRIVRTGKSKTEVTTKKPALEVLYVLLKLTTDTWLWNHYSMSCVWQHELCSTSINVTTSLVLCENYIGCQSVNESYISCFLVHRSSLGQSPDYITDLLQPVAATSSQSSMRDASRGDYVAPRTNRKTADRAFSTAAPSAWNQLPT